MVSREYALKGLEALLSQGAYSNQVIDGFCEDVAKTRQEKAFFTRLFLGCIENLLLLDRYISLVSKPPLKKIKPVILNVLRLSVYQLVFMDSVPDHAAISLALRLLEKRKLTGLKPFVNGVLGNISRNKESLSKELFRGLSPLETLSLKYSVPEFILDYWKDIIPLECIEEMLTCMRKDGGICLRVNESKIKLSEALKELEAAVIKCNPLEGLPAIRVSGEISPRQIPGFMKGYYYIMERASIRAVMAAGINPGEKILDLCASPGGKGLFAAELTGAEGHVTLRDLTDKKVSTIMENANRLDYSNVTIQKHDARVFDNELREKMDLVICDLPCSGLGNIGTKPEIALRATMDSIRELSGIQREILSIAGDYVRPGGRLLFSTCTIGKLENEDNVKAFKEKYPEFELLSTDTILPDREGSDGFFYALFKKND